MSPRERMQAAWNGQPSGYVPLATWCFGVTAPPHLRWRRHGREVVHWYSMRMEHIHTTPQPWVLEDDFERVLTWRALGVDDVLDVSVPWSLDPAVTWQDERIPGESDRGCPLLVREYHTPSGTLSHQVRQTEGQGRGWVVQPDHVPLFEDYNIPRAVRHAARGPSDVPVVKHLYQAPDAEARAHFAARMAKVRRFADRYGVPVQAWSAFGMDAVVWLAGAEGAILMAVDDPVAFGQLVEIIVTADLGRTELAVTTPGADMVVQRGWYSSTDFWSPALFDKFVYPHVQEVASLAHQHGLKFAYVMTTGVETLGPRLADAGVDVLYFVDPVQDRLSLERVRDLLGGRMTLVGGINALTLASGDRSDIRDAVHRAVQVLGPTHRFILQPVDALFPDTPWEGVEALIDAWVEVRDLA